MGRFLMLVTSLAALGFGAGQAMAAEQVATYSPPDQELGSLNQQIQNDYAAIAQDKARMDHDQQAGNTAAYRVDQNRLYADTVTQEVHRGTDRDTTIGWSGKSRGW